MRRVCNFFPFLFEHERMFPSSIQRVTDLPSIRFGAHQGNCLSTLFTFHSLLKSFRVDRPRSAFTFPWWDLNLVLRVHADSSSFPPGGRLSSLFLSPGFLLLLASACCRGNIHAIDPNRVTSTPSSVWSLCPGYLPKIHNTAEGELSLLLTDRH